MNKKVVITGAVLILFAIILGAFGAHALKSIISAERLVSFETGVKYQFYMGLALLIIGLNGVIQNKWFYLLLTSGVTFFSGSIYLLALQDVIGIQMKFLGPITPIGGMLMIIAWVSFIFQIIRH